MISHHHLTILQGSLDHVSLLMVFSVVISNVPLLMTTEKVTLVDIVLFFVVVIALLETVSIEIATMEFF